MASPRNANDEALDVFWKSEGLVLRGSGFPVPPDQKGCRICWNVAVSVYNMCASPCALHVIAAPKARLLGAWQKQDGVTRCCIRPIDAPADACCIQAVLAYLSWRVASFHVRVCVHALQDSEYKICPKACSAVDCA